MKIIGIIPARFGSTRFPGKPLANINGVSMIQRVYERAIQAPSLSEVVIATDDDRIFDHVLHFGGNVMLTSSDHPSGTDRCLEVLEKSYPDADAVINIQGDEPFVAIQQIEALAHLIASEGVDIATLVKKIDDPAILFDSNKVKVVFDGHHKAMYFSRQAIPFVKNVPEEQWINHATFYKHLGLYAYRADVLREVAALPQGVFERAESLEQLRWLQAGKSIFVAETDIETPAIDTVDDLHHVLKTYFPEA